MQIVITYKSNKQQIKKATFLQTAFFDIFSKMILNQLT